jgi:hypothetical protein
MNYVDLCARVQDTVENTFTDAQLALFCQQTEQKAYNTVQPPAVRANVTGFVTPGNPYLTVPDDFLYVFSMASIGADGSYEFLVNKDVNFLREAYPSPPVTGRPKVYAQFDQDTFMLAPTPDTAYNIELHFARYPASIVVAGTSWLGDNMDSVLLNGMLLEAARFMKADADIITLYGKMFDSSLADLKQLADGKLRQDAYRTGQTRIPVR